jgi:hypothetical protein
LGYAEDKSNDEDKFNFRQASAGFAWRPVDFDRINILGRYTYTFDLPLEYRISFVELTEQIKHVTSFDAIFDLTEKFQLAEKIAYRKMSERVGNRGFVDSDTWLWINGINFRFYEKWLLGLEYRILDNTTFKDRTSGYLVQIKRSMNDWIDMTLGFNFTGFDDDLSNRDEYDRSGFFIRLEGRY